MTDRATETRALIDRVRRDISPERQADALRDLARTADGEPRVDAEMLGREAEEVEANVCEHGDHPASNGWRFCSAACQECELADAADGEECAGLCDAHKGESSLAARPRAAWHEDDGAVLWWAWPVREPPYVGTPLDDDFPGYVTHWTPITVPDRIDDDAREGAQGDDR